MMYDITNAQWRKSSRSGESGDCVEVADNVAVSDPAAMGGITAVVAVRDSKDRGGPVLTLSPGAWREFVQGAKRGEFDLA
jgi:Domain of unknown function (DUF397)